ncbi:MAG: hypothetical protein JWQ30_148, partial [Sediminibacterium sp.]|nr:hypothetical protein [Sediminibacterium sp.]
TWKSALKWSVGVFLVSLLLSTISWKWFGNDYNFGESSLLDINFFATICNFFTVIGLGLTVFQVSKLKNEEQLTLAIQQEMLRSEIKNSSLIKCGSIRALLELLSIRIQDEVVFSRQTLLDYAYMANECAHIMKFIVRTQADLTGTGLMDGSEALSLLEQLYLGFGQMDESTIKEFPKQRYLLQVKQVLLQMETCENTLKH